MAARAPRNRLALGREHLRCCLGQALGLVTYARQGADIGDLLGKGDGLGQQVVAGDNLIDDPEFPGLRRGHMTPRYDQVQRCFRPDNPRQALRAAATGNYADQNFRQPDLCRGHRDAVVAGQSIFQTAA